MKALRFDHFGDIDDLALAELARPAADAGTAVIRVLAASINPSDVANLRGRMEWTSLPRVPGRDYAGVVEAGPAEWLGAEVWGTGGDIGFSRDGSHAQYLAVPVASLRRKPATLSFEQAASVGVNFLTASAGLQAAALKAGETVVFIGAGGGVGNAAAQIAHRLGARYIGIGEHQPPAEAPVSRIADPFLIDAPAALPERIAELTAGRRAEVVFNAVGGALFETGLELVAQRGRVVSIASPAQRRVDFDVIHFYHRETTLIGVDSGKYDAVRSGEVLESLAAGFDEGSFAPPLIEAAYPLEAAAEAYRRVAAGHTAGRIVLLPWA